MGIFYAKDPRDERTSSNSDLSLETHSYEEIVDHMESKVGEITVEADSGREIHAMLGIVTEAGELADQFKRWIFYKTEHDRVNVIEELGDVMWYVALMCNVLKIPMEEVILANVRKLQKRYPDRFTTDKAVNRNVDREREELEESLRTIDNETE